MLEFVMHGGFYSILFYILLILWHFIAKFIVLSSYFILLVIYISVTVCTHNCGKGRNMDEKYDHSIFYFLRRVEFVNLVTYWF